MSGAYAVLSLAKLPTLLGCRFFAIPVACAMLKRTISSLSSLFRNFYVEATCRAAASECPVSRTAAS